ncbi:MAG: phosphoribosylanthranilate isomerase [Desulfobacterales bacterium]|jgi:phosphoribosylanthranilate isomerase
MKRVIQIKVCGLTEAKTAAACAALKIEAVGLVFYPKSPRYLSDAQAEEIAAAVNRRAAVIGVFVDELADVILKKAQRCGLTGVQLHGCETPAEVTQLKSTGLTVIKALFQKREPSFQSISRYDPSAFLLECGRGRLPGGTARAWDWADAKAIAANAPVILAGGLTPVNVGQAVRLGRPHAVDVSSGVETSPGKKDLAKIEAFVSAVAGIVPTPGDEKARRIFK